MLTVAEISSLIKVTILYYSVIPISLRLSVPMARESPIREYRQFESAWIYI
jgi:hypothetical protein